MFRDAAVGLDGRQAISFPLCSPQNRHEEVAEQSDSYQLALSTRMSDYSTFPTALLRHSNVSTESGQVLTPFI